MPSRRGQITCADHPRALAPHRSSCQAGRVFERFTDAARHVLVLAQEEARLLDHGFIGTEHLLLGLLKQDGEAVRLLVEQGASLPVVRSRVEETIGLAGGPPTGSPPFTPRAKKALELALREAVRLGSHNIGSEHILLGVIREGEGVGVQVLVGLGIDLTAVCRRISEQLAAVDEGVPSTGLRFDDVPADDDVDRGTVVVCSFCGLAPPASGRLVSGNNAFICENCILRWSRRLGTDPRRSGRGWASKASSTAMAPFEPEGAAAARDEIRAAFAASRVPSDDGRSVPAVERGTDLGPTLVLANGRHPGIVGDGSNVTISADEIRFYDTGRAAVWFSISLGDRTLLGGQQGEAVLVDGQWKMARTTFCRLMELAGVACPPEAG